MSQHGTVTIYTPDAVFFDAFKNKPAKSDVGYNQETGLYSYSRSAIKSKNSDSFDEYRDEFIQASKMFKTIPVGFAYDMEGVTPGVCVDVVKNGIVVREDMSLENYENLAKTQNNPSDKKYALYRIYNHSEKPFVDNMWIRYASEDDIKHDNEGWSPDGKTVHEIHCEKSLTELLGNSNHWPMDIVFDPDFTESERAEIVRFSNEAMRDEDFVWNFKKPVITQDVQVGDFRFEDSGANVYYTWHYTNDYDSGITFGRIDDKTLPMGSDDQNDIVYHGTLEEMAAYAKQELGSNYNKAFLDGYFNTKNLPPHIAEKLESELNSNFELERGNIVYHVESFSTKKDIINNISKDTYVFKDAKSLYEYLADEVVAEDKNLAECSSGYKRTALFSKDGAFFSDCSQAPVDGRPGLFENYQRTVGRAFVANVGCMKPMSLNKCDFIEATKDTFDEAKLASFSSKLDSGLNKTSVIKNVRLSPQDAENLLHISDAKDSTTRNWCTDYTDMKTNGHANFDVISTEHMSAIENQEFGKSVFIENIPPKCFKSIHKNDEAFYGVSVQVPKTVSQSGYVNVTASINSNLADNYYGNAGYKKSECPTKPTTLMYPKDSVRTVSLVDENGQRIKQQMKMSDLATYHKEFYDSQRALIQKTVQQGKSVAEVDKAKDMDLGK